MSLATFKCATGPSQLPFQLFLRQVLLLLLWLPLLSMLCRIHVTYLAVSLSAAVAAFSPAAALSVAAAAGSSAAVALTLPAVATGVLSVAVATSRSDFLTAPTPDCQLVMQKKSKVQFRDRAGIAESGATGLKSD